ncbi:hypothetical protein H6G91_39290 [Nostoc muscorum FACHB-395]|jgi:hypothetical protein|uniref:hypothetical protein n=1 Tax=Nostoc sp. TCL240-02 TaxID=2572090 RepID=UPI00157F85D4|nr:hypothetical protein [Nostoc sp. TCL240-02]MBD2513138.1 hypothetical protein [Desmonostoc muscorum FACHB-395]QKQ73175.1 hypothetical protein FBB35_07150 [Nostoc sp. TCL240-02]QKQ73366.1 hypothetical protein FBB35_08290 [Nostoc sp. TCL240-02]
MSKQQVVDRIKEYISELELPEVDSKLPKVFRSESLAFQNDTPGAAANAGSLVSFVSGLTQEHKSDVLNSTLLAQLAATKKYDRFKQTRQWYEFYTSVLAQVGWVVPAFAYREYSPSGSSFLVADAIIEILKAIATGNEMDILVTSLNALKNNPKNEGSLTLFEQQSFPENLGTFQVLPVGEDDGQLVMAMSALEFRADKHVTRFLWFSWSNVSTKLFQSSQKAVLNEDVYSRVRAEVIKKLGDRASQYIKDIEI